VKEGGTVSVAELASELSSGALLERLQRDHAGFDLLDHWQQGEFHHDFVLQLRDPRELPGPIVVFSTNCNAGVKEVLCLAERPSRGGLWHSRCPDNPEFEGVAPVVLDHARTSHWFDPCEVLKPDARSEFREEFRERQPGGGWQLKTCQTARTQK